MANAGIQLAGRERRISSRPPEDFPATASIDTLLRKARFLDGLSHSERSAVLERAESRSYPVNAVIAEQATAADRLFLLVSGCARYFFLTPEGRKVNLLLLLPGEIFGGASLLAKPAQFIVSTEITQVSTVLVWQRDTIQALAAQIPTLLENGLAIAYDYLVWYLATHLSLIADSARERLAHVLVSLSRGIGQKRATGISLEITNEQLANTANISIFTVSRLLSEWQRNGAVTKSRGKILLRRAERLFDTTP
jgi:CRP-like cAMP-binding protein